VQELSGRFLKDPRVLVRVIEYRKFFVSGAVENPGAYPYLPGTTVRQAIIVAGGRKGNTRKILRIARGDRTDETEDLDTIVLPDDVITVSEVTGCTNCEAISETSSDMGAETSEARGYVIGSTVLYPRVTLSVEHDDNIFREGEDTRDSLITILAPNASWQGGNPLWGYRFDYRGAYGVFHDSTDDNYDDHLISAQTSVGITANSDLNVIGSVDFGHDRRGTELSEQNPELRDEPDRWRSPSIRATYEYGIGAGGLGYSLEAGYLLREYTNNRDVTRTRDRDEVTFAARTYYSLRSMLDIFGEYRYRDINYDIDVPLNSRVHQVSAGVEYEVEERLSLAFRAGVENRDFVNTGEDVTEPSLEGAVEWHINQFNVIEASARRETSEGVLPAEQFRVSTQFSVDWIYRLSDRLSTRAGGSYGERDIDGPNVNRTNDNIYGLSLQASYSLKYWLTGSLGYEYTKRNSDDDLFDYDLNVIRVSLSASF
jgi:hypothetical protein